MTNVVPLFRRVVVTKIATYELEPHQVGRSAVDVFGAETAERLGVSNATIYDMPDTRRVIARPGDEHQGSK